MTAISIVHDGRDTILEVEQVVPACRDRLFSFFSIAENLERLTPDTLRFQILTPAPIDMGAGAMIDYALRIHRVPVRWKTEITLWEPPQRFMDVQRRGPYHTWEHLHEFRVIDENSTLMVDRVRYRPRGGRVVNRLFVERDVRKIFAYRARQIEVLFGKAEQLHTPA